MKKFLDRCVYILGIVFLLCVALNLCAAKKNHKPLPIIYQGPIDSCSYFNMEGVRLPRHIVKLAIRAWQTEMTKAENDSLCKYFDE